MRSLNISLVLLLSMGCAKVSPSAPSVTPPAQQPQPPPASPPAQVQPMGVTLIVGPDSPVRDSAASFSALASLSQPTEPTTYEWNFGNGQRRMTNANTTYYAYPATGFFEVTVDLTDGQGRHARGLTTIQVRQPPPDPPAPTPAPPQTTTLDAFLTCTQTVHGSPTPCNVNVSYRGAVLPANAITQVVWNWGDGFSDTTTPPTAPINTRTYASAGRYIVFVTVTATTVDGPKTATTSLALTIP